MSYKELKLVKGYPGSEFKKPFDPGSVLPQNAILVEKKRAELASLAPMDEATKKEVATLVFTGTEKQKNEIASARIDRIGLNVLEDLIGMDFFEVTELAHDEIPQLVLQRDQQWVSSQIGMHGGAPYDQFENLDTISQYTPYILKSDIALYPIMSPIIGRFTEVAERVNNRVSHDWNRKMDDDLFTLMDANYETIFANPETIYDLDPKIVTAGAYPSGNNVDLSATPGVNLNMFKKIFQHFANMGDGAPRVRTIWIPSTELENLWAIGSVTSGFTGATPQPTDTVHESIWKEIQTKGIIGNLFGNTFRLRVTNTFDNEFVRVTTDRPYGRLYMKPEFDRVKRYSEDDVEARNSIQNHEGIQISKVVVPIIPSPWKLNSLRIKIN